MNACQREKAGVFFSLLHSSTQIFLPNDGASQRFLCNISNVLGKKFTRDFCTLHCIALHKKSLGSGEASAEHREEHREEPGEIEPFGVVYVALRF